MRVQLGINKVIIGDVHTKVDRLIELINLFELKYSTVYETELTTIQVGDLGFRNSHELFINTLDVNRHKVNFGNHDDYGYLNHNHSLGNFSYDESTGIFTVRGAMSIDKHLRTIDVDLFENEELNYQEQLECYDAYIKYKPRIVVSHDTTVDARSMLHNIHDAPHNKSGTSQLLQELFNEHKPEFWIYGHIHKSRDRKINNTRFICLEELEFLDLY